jgi:hypothetical protein
LKYNFLVEGEYAPGSRIEYPDSKKLPSLIKEVESILC